MDGEEFKKFFEDFYFLIECFYEFIRDYCDKCIDDIIVKIYWEMIFICNDI